MATRDVTPTAGPTEVLTAHALEVDAEAIQDLVRTVAEHAVGVAGQVGRRPIMPDDPVALDAAVRGMLEPPADGPGELPELLARLDQAASCAAEVGDPRFFAFMPTGGIVASALGEIYAQLVNRFVGASMAAPAFAAMEHGVLRWLAGVVGMPEGSGGLLLSGGSMANFTAVGTAAREVERRGEFGTVYLGDQAHLSILKAIRMAGIPADRIRVVPADASLRMDVGALRQAIHADREAGLTPSLLVGTGGTAATGAVDPLRELAEVARQEGAWFHIDGAYGALFRLTERGRAATVGMELADSVTLDPHKALFLPCGTGALVVRDVARLRAAHSFSNDVVDVSQMLRTDDDLPDFMELGLELTREARGPRLWLPLHLYGTAAFRAALDEKLDLARTAYERLAASPVLETPWRPDLAVVAFRIPQSGDVGSANAANERLEEAINATGRALVSSAMIDGQLTLRMSILSHRTRPEHVETALDIIENLAEELSGTERRR